MRMPDAALASGSAPRAGWAAGRSSVWMSTKAAHSLRRIIPADRRRAAVFAKRTSHRLIMGRSPGRFLVRFAGFQETQLLQAIAADVLRRGQLFHLSLPNDLLAQRLHWHPEMDRRRRWGFFARRSDQRREAPRAAPEDFVPGHLAALSA